LLDPNNAAGGAKKNAGVSGPQAGNNQPQVDPKFQPKRPMKKASMVVEVSQPNGDDDSTVLGGNSSGGEEDDEEISANEQSQRDPIIR
jgi:hypothetical protein